MAETYYQIGEFVIKVTHENDEIFKRIDEELKDHEIKNPEENHGIIKINFSEEENSNLPKKSILKEKILLAPEIFEEKYMERETEYILVTDTGSIKKEYLNRKVSINQKKNLSKIGKKRLEDLSRNVVKWLIIKIAEQEGYTFSHGAALDYKNKRVMFIGDSGCGKSSFLARLKSFGGEVITDDAILHKEGHTIYFSFQASVKGDFSSRFEVDEKEKHALTNSKKNKKEIKKIDLIIFPRVWNNSKSKLEKLEKKESLKMLYEIYKKETSENGYLLPKKEINRRNEKLIEDVACFNFYAGSSEQEVRNSLIKLIDGEMKND